MVIKDYIVIFISGSALTLSLISLIITLVQKNKEVKRTIRKTLSDTLESISKINIETTKLKSSKDIDDNSEAIISLRRTYNAQRRVLIAHADFLISKYDNVSTEIDCNILAAAYATVGDQEKSEYFWKKTIDKSISLPIKHMNLRGFGTFLFHNDKIDLGRKCFNDALSIKLAENDDNRILQTDTYLMLSELEKEKGNKEEYDLNFSEAIGVLSTIKNERRKNEMHGRMRRHLPIV